MYRGRIIFSQIMDWLPRYEFDKCVQRYRGDNRVRTFTCYDQFLTMAFAQLTYRESLRDIETCLTALKPKLYHAGISGSVSRSTLAEANEKRDWRIFADFAQVLIGQARVLYAKEDFGVELDQAAYALDSTTIDLCLSLFPWAKFRKRNGAIKLHTLLDLRGNFPSTVIVTSGKVSDVKILDRLVFEPGAFYIMDRGYVDFARLYSIDLSSSFFITRAKKNFQFTRRYSHPVDKTTGLRCDQTIILKGFYAKKRLSRSATPRWLFRCRDQQKIRFSYQQFHSTNSDNSGFIQMPVARGTVFQVDQATPAHQGILRHIRKCGEDTSVDRHLGLCLDCHHQKAIEAGSESLHNSTDFERHAFRKNAHFRGVFRLVAC